MVRITLKKAKDLDNFKYLKNKILNSKTLKYLSNFI
jgi:hypothetical protein